jgi:hypothetical protein
VTLVPDYNDAWNFVHALTGNADGTVMHWRGIPDDKRSDDLPFTRSGTLANSWHELCAWNASGRGVFVIINQTDGIGREVQNVTVIRAQFVDLDKGNVEQNYRTAYNWNPAPHFVVNSSPGKYHLYWTVEPYLDVQKFTDIQARLIAAFGGDITIKDAPRVMRVPGFAHLKGVPHLSRLYTGNTWNTPRISADTLAASLAQFDPGDVGGAGSTEALGDIRLSAPTFMHAVNALNMIDPSELSYEDWRDTTFAFKQAIWRHTTPEIARMMFDAWTTKSAKNQLGESNKLWNGIKSARSGWPGLERRSGFGAMAMFGTGPARMPDPSTLPSSSPAPATMQQQAAAIPPVPGSGGTGEVFGHFLTPAEQERYFKGCVLIEKDGRILTASMRLMDATRFNAKYGGHQFQIKDDGAGSTTDEPWKAATRGQLYSIPKVDHTRFLPMREPGELVTDELGRNGINTWLPPVIDMKPGDPSPFVNHLRRILPTEGDLLILLNYFARIVQTPGVKIPWAPVIQSAEGVGKNVIKLCMSHAVGNVYCYYPKASELAESGGKFNAWMRGRLFILCDEVRTDERRDLIETLKDMISEDRIQVQLKGIDADIDDNFGNWVFFTNHKDAVPINRKTRRWSIFYSQLQTEADIVNAGFNAQYFSTLYDWIRFGGGKEIVAHYLKNFIIDPALDPLLNQRAPKTSSYEEVINASRTGPELAILEAVESALPGFRGGWVSSVKMMELFREHDLRAPTPVIISRIMGELGYRRMGRAARGFIQEGGRQPNLWSKLPNAQVATYGSDQGYM